MYFDTSLKTSRRDCSGISKSRAPVTHGVLFFCQKRIVGVRREKRGDGREWWNMRGQFRKTLPSTRRTQVWKRRCVLSGDTVRQTLSFVTKLSRVDVLEDQADIRQDKKKKRGMSLDIR